MFLRPFLGGLPPFVVGFYGTVRQRTTLSCISVRPMSSNPNYQLRVRAGLVRACGNGGDRVGLRNFYKCTLRNPRADANPFNT